MSYSVTLAGCTFTDTDFTGYGHTAVVTLPGPGTSYPRFQAIHVAGLYDVATNVALAATYSSAAGGAGWSTRLGFDAGTADANPGAGLLRYNNATPSAATALYISTTDANGVDISVALSLISAPTSTLKGFVRIGHRLDPTKWHLFSVSAFTSATGYDKLTVAYVSGYGTLLSTDPITLSFQRTGDKGDTGMTGSTGPSGNASIYVGSNTNLLTTSNDYVVNTSAAPITVTLPASPTVGVNYTIFDISGTWATNNLTIARNGNTIESVASDLVCDMSYARFSIWWNGSTWKVSAASPFNR